MKTLLNENKLIIGIIIGVVLGGIVGTYWPNVGADMKILGELFLNALKMIVIPLILVSITLSIMKVGNLGSVGLKTVIYYVVTTARHDERNNDRKLSKNNRRDYQSD